MKMALIPVMICQILAVKIINLIRYLLTPEAPPRRCYFFKIVLKSLVKFPRKDLIYFPKKGVLQNFGLQIY